MMSTVRRARIGKQKILAFQILKIPYKATGIRGLGNTWGKQLKYT